MAVRCPGCGRDYDVTLFAFGRTLDCTCGRRVGLEARATFPTLGEAPRFVADASLGRLARWLRMLGFDTAWSPQSRAEDLARQAWQELRVVLTASRALPERWRLPRVIVLQSGDLVQQLRQLERELALSSKQHPFTRCSRCNERLEEVPAEQVADRVPPRVAQEQTHFSRCPVCARIYWAGSHVARMRERMRASPHESGAATEASHQEP